MINASFRYATQASIVVFYGVDMRTVEKIILSHEVIDVIIETGWHTNYEIIGLEKAHHSDNVFLLALRHYWCGESQVKLKIEEQSCISKLVGKFIRFGLGKPNILIGNFVVFHAYLGYDTYIGIAIDQSGKPIMHPIQKFETWCDHFQIKV
jgi:hypothetical protein